MATSKLVGVKRYAFRYSVGVNTTTLNEAFRGCHQAVRLRYFNRGYQMSFFFKDINADTDWWIGAVGNECG